MNITINEHKGLDFSAVEVGDLLAFHNNEGEISNVYIICYNDYEEKYYLQNLNGSKSKLRYYTSIRKMLEFKRSGKIIKSKNINLEITKIFMEL